MFHIKSHQKFRKWIDHLEDTGVCPEGLRWARQRGRHCSMREGVSAMLTSESFDPAWASWVIITHFLDFDADIQQLFIDEVSKEPRRAAEHYINSENLTVNQADQLYDAFKDTLPTIMQELKERIIVPKERI